MPTALSDTPARDLAAGTGPRERPAAADALLSLRGVRKSYGGVAVAVEGVDLDLAPGEILTLLGPSGCGKTSTLRIAIGLERASDGEVWLGGQLVDAPARRIFVPPERRNMGMVFQSYAIWPHMSVFENVAYPLQARRRPAAEIKAEVDRLLDMTGLSSFADRPGTRLSGGQQQRVAIARGLAAGSGVLLMDEPFSNLDSHLRNHMRAEVKLLQRKLGIAVLFVTHDQSEALALSDRIAVMRAGRIEQIGPPTELYNNPASANVRDFLGENMRLSGRVRARGRDAGLTVELSEGNICLVDGQDHTGGAPVGSPCLLSIRPEHVRVEPAPAGPHTVEPNVVAGRILAMLFLGSAFEASVRLASGAVVTTMLGSDTELKEGQAVRLVLPKLRLHAWPED
ncbi:ABC transporter ATP-binding protein [Ancylobacter mangrovi]|uniref:ABC transporter ATP-binding protein n=1 Tax=Ancylobacter mangrovi TaxID=2972472 RepID=UPI0021624921|nr:ABC transporter ATP-binding protein [Ancylobacter mangrovi]MCS0503726.1 ABC transporter ATP-binding protein [Ancylobacter mangrovi]